MTDSSHGSGRRWLPPHDPAEGWDELSDEDRAEMLDPASAEADLIPLGGPLDDDAARDGLYAADLDAETTEPDSRDPDSAAGAAELAAVEAVLDTRWPETKIEPSLDRIARLMDVLGEPQHAYPVVHIAGTNGKTTVARMVDALLRALHQRTGRTTSPHLQTVTERISVDGEPVSPGTFAAQWREIEPLVELVDAWSTERGGPRMSYFEVLTALALATFADAPVDVAVIETGMGGAWDATNVVDPAVAVITPIGLDHTDYLGETLEQIAGEKAGIIKGTEVRPGEDLLALRDKVAVIGRQDPAAERVLLARAQEVGAVVARLGSEFEVLDRATAVGGQMLTLRGLGGTYEEIFVPLFGAHQADNAAVALATVEAYFGAGPGRRLDPELIRAGFAAVDSPGRLERVSQSPTVFVDAAHNAHGGDALAAALREEFDFQRLVAVVGMLGGKDAHGLMRALEPLVAEVVITETASPRAVPAQELALVAEEVFGPDRVTVTDGMAEALEVALELVAMSDPTADGATGGEGVIVTGSVVTAGVARDLFGKEPR